MLLPSLGGWARRLAHSRDDRPVRSRARRLALERLEDRLAPAIDMLDVGGLRFLASDGFTQDGNNYTADAGTVSIGYAPTSGEDFLALLQADLTSQTGGSLVVSDIVNPEFSLLKATLDLVVVGGSPTVPIPIWQTSDASLVEFDIDKLLGEGVSLDPADAKPIEVVKVDFSLSEILFANPGGGDTSDAQVKMQGSASFANVPLVKDLNVTAEVQGTNYVVADTAKLDLTGLEVTKDLPSKATLAGLALSGSITIGYNHPSNAFTFGGTVSLTSKDQDGGQTGLKNVSAGLDLTLTDGTVTALGFDIGGSFAIFGLSVSTLSNQPLSFQYDLTDQQYEIGGGLKLAFRGNEIEADFGSSTSPGIIIQDGELTKLNATVTAEFELFGAQVTTTPSLNFSYNRSQAQFEMYGGLKLTVSSTSITALMGSQSNPGLILQDGDLKQLNLGISGRFSVFGLQVVVNQATVEWKSESGGDVLIVNGDFEADFSSFMIDLKLGSDSNPDGLKIKNGDFQVGGIKITMKDADFGAFTIEELVVQWMPANPGFDLDVAVDLTFPGGFTVGGSLDFQNGVLNDLSLQFQSTEGIVVGDTGLFLTEIDASVKNLDDSSKLIVSGAVAFTFGETFTILGKEVKLFRVEGQFTVDADELIVQADAWVGAFSPDDGNTWQGLLGKGDAKLTLDWGDKIYGLHVEIDGLAVSFDLIGDFTFAAGKDIRFLAEVDVVIPDVVPFIGGDKIGGLGFFFDHTFRAPITTTFAAWIELHIIHKVEVGFEVAYPGADVRLIGAGAIDKFKKESEPPADRTYTYTADLQGLVPANATAATLHADWSKPAAKVTILGRPKFRVQQTVNGKTFTYKEDEFAAHGIALITDPNFDTATTKAIQIVGSSTDPFAPLEGDYKLLVDVVAEGGNPFPDYGKSGTFPDDLQIQATYHIPKPIFGKKGAAQPYVPTVPPTPAGSFPVTLQGNMDEGFLAGGKAKVSLYRVLVQDPRQRPVLVGTAVPKQISGDGVNWQAEIDVPIDGLYPLPYALYAVVNDGFNVPVQTGNSAPFTPGFAVQGSVANQLDDALTGWSVYLDYNQNGVHDADEPITQTSTPDGSYAFTPTFAPSTGWDPVPVNTPFNVQLVVPSDQFVPEQDPVTITFNGADTKVVNFAVKEKTAILGEVFIDQGNNGEPGDGTPLAGATVYLDANDNGVRDAGEQTRLTGSDGGYAFRKLTAGTYTVGLDVHAETPAASYVVPAGTVGNDQWGGALGLAFDVTKPIDVTSLGVFDSGGDGLQGTLTATLYDRVTQAAITTLKFTSQDPGTLIGGSRFKPLAQPITLLAGFQGMIVADGFVGDDRYGNNLLPPFAGKAPPWTTDAGNGQLSFLHGFFSDTPNTFPTKRNTQGPNPYAAGTFLFADPIRTQTSPASKTYSVTLDNSGFDVKDGNDFGVQPFSTLSGTITGKERDKGKLSPNGTPQSGVTVHLIQNGYVVGSTITGNAGGYTFRGVRPETYSVEQVVPTGYRQVTPFGGDFQLQDPSGGNTWSLANDDAFLPVVADFDGNGQAGFTVLTDSKVYVFYNGDLNQPSALLYGGLTDPGGSVAGSFGDALPALLVLDGSGEVVVLSNQGGRLQNGSGRGSLPGFGGDGVYQDVVPGNFFQSEGVPGGQLAALYGISNDRGARVVTFGQGIRTPVVESTGLASAVPANLAPGDVNGDGFTDLFIPTQLNNPIVYHGDGHGNFTPITIPSLPGGFTSVVGDINGDGLLDLGITDADGLFHYALQDTSGNFTQAFTAGIRILGYNEPLLQDVNGDFLPDLVWVDFGCPGEHAVLQVALNTGASGNWFTPDQVKSLPLFGVGASAELAFEIATGDVDGDGFLDIVAAGGNGDEALVELVHNRTTILPAPIRVQVQPAQNPSGIDFINAQLPRSLHHVLAMPPDTGAGDWTVRVHQGRLEVHDREFGLWDSQLLDDLRSLTIIGADGRPNRVTIDLTQADIPLPGGITFQGSTGQDDTLRFLLGDQDDGVTVADRMATLNGLLTVTWTDLDTLTVQAGAGNDILQVSGTPLAGETILDGGAGNDAYALATQDSTLHIHDGAGVDTLDFGGAFDGVTVNLGLDRGQRQAIGEGNRLHLNGVIENGIGSAFIDTIQGNAVNNRLDGGGADDVLLGHQGHDILIGGDGNDNLLGGDDRDLLIGGPGDDLLFGGPGDDILIGGTTAFDDDAAALGAILAEWTSPRSFPTRMENLIEGTGSPARANGSIFLTSRTVFDDQAVDTLFGGPGLDWFLDTPPDSVADPEPQPPRVSSVSGTLFVDTNANGTQDPGEAGVAGRTIYADLNRNQRPDPGEPADTTDAQGRYTLTGLPLGAFDVRADLPRGAYAFTIPASGGRLVTLNGANPDATGIDFGVVPATPSRPPAGIARFDPRTATWYVRHSSDAGNPDVVPFAYGSPGWTPLTGDWDGDGVETVGTFDPTTATWYLRDSNSAGPPDIDPFAYGWGGWVPVVGDWDGDGTDTVGMFDPATATWYLRDSNSAGAPEVTPFAYGWGGWVPVVGDWDGDGAETVGMFDPATATWYLRDSNSAGAPEVTPFAYGWGGWVPVVGDWDGDGTDTVGVTDPGGFWYLRNSNSAGASDAGAFSFGQGGWLPLPAAGRAPVVEETLALDSEVDLLGSLALELLREQRQQGARLAGPPRDDPPGD